MPKRGKMFAGITRQVVISDETHQLLCEAAQHENKYLGELADELLRSILTRQPRESQYTNGRRYGQHTAPAMVLPPAPLPRSQTDGVHAGGHSEPELTGLTPCLPK
jgi:hypothetical protein